MTRIPPLTGAVSLSLSLFLSLSLCTLPCRDQYQAVPCGSEQPAMHGASSVMQGASSVAASLLLSGTAELTRGSMAAPHRARQSETARANFGRSEITPVGPDEPAATRVVATRMAATRMAATRIKNRDGPNRP